MGKLYVLSILSKINLSSNIIKLDIKKGGVS